MKRLFLCAVLAGCGGQTASAPAPAPSVAAAPDAKRAADFTLVDTEGKSVALHDLLQKGPVILAFFPKAFTAG